jgi:HD-GYP domain-containing protein (c-di-GMP phosphodiesterase class II)
VEKQTVIVSITTKIVALVCYAVLVYITTRRSLKIRVNRLFTLYLITMVSWQIAALMVSLSDRASMALLWYKLLLTGVSGQFLIYFLFTQAFLQIRGQKGVICVGLLAWIATLILTVSSTPQFIPNVYRDESTGLFVPSFGVLMDIVAPISYSVLGYGVFNLFQGYRRARSDLERKRLRYILLGISAFIAGTFANFVPALRAYPIDIVANIVNALFIAYAILRYQLLDITLVIRKGLFYSIPTAIIGATYFLLISLCLRLFHAFGDPQIFLLSLLVAIITAVAAQPLRDRAQLWVDRLFFREKYDSSLMFQRLSGAVASVLDLDRLTGMILDEVTTTMHIESAAFFLKQDESGELRLMAQRGLDQNANLRLRKDHPFVDWLSSHGYVLTRHGVDVMPQLKALWVEEREDLKRVGAELFVSLKAKGELVGIFAVGPKLSGETYSQDDQLILTTLANQTAVAIENARLYQEARRELAKRMGAEEELRQSYVKLRRALEGTIHALISAVEMRDPYTAGHQQRVTQLACAIANEMGLPEEQIEGIHMAGLVHDIGKINVPAEILSKPGRLNDLEFGLIKTHSQVGHNILNGTIEFPWPIAQIVLQHHERMDGSGYPVGLSGEEIILEARILAVADVVEAMASHRPYRPARGIDQALEEISQNRGILYDPEVVDACLKLFSEKRFKFE